MSGKMMPTGNSDAGFKGRPSSMRELICTALNNKQRIRFVYHDKVRLAEPQCCGISTTDKEVVRFYLLQEEVVLSNYSSFLK